MLLTQNYRPRRNQHHQPPQPTPYDLDIDALSALDALDVLEAAGLSSPISNQSLLSPPYSSLDSAAPLISSTQTSDVLSLSPPTPTFDDLSLPHHNLPDLMQPESWALGAQLTPKSVGRLSHKRESSLSSLGSAGPASPYSHNTSNPQIAVTDPSGDGFGEMPSDGAYYQLAKSIVPGDNIYGQYHGFGTDGAIAASLYAPTMGAPKPRSDRTLLPAPELSLPVSRSHPVSVASSVAGDSPATPLLQEPAEDDRRRKNAFHNIPKLDRTMTDVYSDELYSPSFSLAAVSPPHSHMPLSPANDVFSQRLQAANTQHLNANQLPVSSIPRGSSPFRHGSPLAPAPPHDFARSAGQPMRFNTAQQMREQGKAEMEAQALRQQLERRTEPDTPKTISPKDSILEFPEVDGNHNFPLFPPQDVSAFGLSPLEKVQSPYQHGGGNSMAGLGSMNNFYMAPQMPASLQVPQQYPFISQHRTTNDTPPRLSSAASSSGESAATGLRKPAGATADGGTYTCTYHGCTLRFETPSLLQKHKREGHRQAQGLTGLRRNEVGGPNSVLNSQAGPHTCERINPSTGKPCNTIFSRPYDLTRHEDTIHNARKQKVRCQLCTEEKTFSRADALTRHFRVCHPEIEIGGKHRRRNAQGTN